jgi:hypothetical protein
MSPSDKKEALAELNDALKAPVPPIGNKGNIDLVAKYYDKLSSPTRSVTISNRRSKKPQENAGSTSRPAIRFARACASSSRQLAPTADKPAAFPRRTSVQGHLAPWHC